MPRHPLPRHDPDSPMSIEIMKVKKCGCNRSPISLPVPIEPKVQPVSYTSTPFRDPIHSFASTTIDDASMLVRPTDRSTRMNGRMLWVRRTARLGTILNRRVQQSGLLELMARKKRLWSESWTILKESSACCNEHPLNRSVARGGKRWNERLMRKVDREHTRLVVWMQRLSKMLKQNIGKSTHRPILRCEPTHDLIRCDEPEEHSEL